MEARGTFNIKMGNILKTLSKKNIRLYTMIVYGIILLLCVLLAYYFMPILLNYGPDTINTEFDKNFSSGLTYRMQYALVFIVTFSIEVVWLLWEMREFSNLSNLQEESKKSKAGYEKFLRIVQKCFTIPKFSFVLLALAPTLAVGLSFFFLNFTSFADFKVLLVVLILSLVAGTLTFIVSKRVFRRVLQNIMNLAILQRGKLKLTPAILFQITPVAVICVMYTFFLSYSNNLDDKSELARKHYTSTILEEMAEVPCNTIMELENMLANTSTLYMNDTISVLDSNGTIYSFANEFTEIYVKPESYEKISTDSIIFYDTSTSDYYSYARNTLTKMSNYTKRNGDLIVNVDIRYLERNKLSPNTYNNINIILQDIESDFFYSYARELAEKNSNKIYGYYGSETQGVLIPVYINGEKIRIAVMYDLSNTNMNPILINLIILLLVSTIIIYNFARSVSKEVTLVTDGIDHLLEGNVESLNRNLPVTSNDELGELVIAFNKVQELTKENIVEIRNNEQMLMEKERLASLGELIGGIAHNMKTPIMSSSGAAEGLTELIAEYRASIDNPVVTPEDHKEIAKDMLDCVTKIKSYNAYMSDIISAVKGQASQLASQENERFTVYDLSKRVEILIKHEIKQANLILTTRIDCDPTLSMTGDINSLIQVVNNLITNSIYAYGGQPGKEIKYVIDSEGNNIIMKVIDEGCGMNEETKAKLFKQMYTTKGKNGTGLGLYMSYSTIRGKFNGNLSFESEEGKGTTFTITIPKVK